MNQEKIIRPVSKVKIIVKYCICVSAVFTVAATVLIFPSQSAQGVKDGLELCIKSVIPSLFPFMVISSFLVQSNILNRIDKLFSKITYFIFRQPGCAGSVIFLSLIGGFPVGANLVRQLYENKKITQSEGQRLLLFCINPGPAFVISCVGFQMLSSQKIGIIIFASVTLSALIIGFLTRFTDTSGEATDISENNQGFELSAGLVSAASKSTNSIIMICGWVIIFSTLSALLKTAGLNESTALFADCMLEVTNGCYKAASVLPASIIAGIIGWGGLCVHCQIMPSVVKLKLNYKLFVTSRIICGALSCVICSFLFQIFRIDVQVIKLNCKAIDAQKPEFLPVSLGLLIMCAIILLGDSLKIKIKTKKQLLK